MTSQMLVRSDVQPPPMLLRRPPNRASSAAVEAIAFAEQACGIVLDDWQRWVVELALAERSDGTWAAFEVGIVCPRQNGKNFILEVIQIACIYLFGDRTLVHSAHKFDTSVEHFNRLKWLFENTPELSELLLPGDSSFVTSNGKEHIRFNTGQRILFKARYRGSGRGFVGDKIFLDEAYDLPAAAIGAMIPTLSTRPMAQVYYTSSAPHDTSTVLHAVRNRAQDDNDDDRLFYVEWGNTADADESDLEAIRRANPGIAAGHISEDYIRQEIRTFSGDPGLLDEHRRERLGIPTPLAGSAEGGNMPNWANCGDELSVIESNHQWAIATSPDRKWSTIGVAGRRADGNAHVATHYRRSGTDWVVDECVAFWESHRIPVRIWKHGPESSFIAPLLERGVKVVEVSTAEVAMATGQLRDGVDAGTVRHPIRDGGQLSSLDRAVAGAELRVSTAGAALWEQRSQVEISPLVAVTVAYGGVPLEQARAPRIYSLTVKR